MQRKSSDYGGNAVEVGYIFLLNEDRRSGSIIKASEDIPKLSKMARNVRCLREIMPLRYDEMPRIMTSHTMSAIGRIYKHSLVILESIPRMILGFW